MKQDKKKEWIDNKDLYEPNYGTYPNCNCPFCNPDNPNEP